MCRYAPFPSRMLLSALLLLLGCGPTSSPNNAVTIVGQMRDAMWKGEIGGRILLDTLPDRAHLYGLGPVEGLSGEIMLLEGRAFRSRVGADSAMQVDEPQGLRAPFFAYARVPRWEAHGLPDSVSDLRGLEAFLLHRHERLGRPFLFRLEGRMEAGTIHAVNLPAGSAVRSPDDAHRGMRYYPVAQEEATALGFFSTRHQAVFTHHDTFQHLHLITADRRKMGHVDALRWAPGQVRLLLPAE